MLKLGTVCSGIGSPEVAMEQLSKDHEFQLENVFACDIDKYARASYLANFTPVKMFTDMTSDDFHDNAEYSDLFIGGIPCQAFSLAGKRLGELDKRGLLFYDFYRYVKEKQPKAFIIENVKGLLSDNKGKTFSNWIHLLARSVNQQEINFPHPDSLEYNIHHTILNSKNFGVPQNRERVFIVGIRKDLSNDFRFPIGYRLNKRLKDVLENNVNQKYYLSDKMLELLTEKKSGSIEVANINKGGQKGSVVSSDGPYVGCLSATDYKLPKLIQIKEKTIVKTDVENIIRPDFIVPAKAEHDCNALIEPICVAMRGRNPENSSDRTTGAPTEQRLEKNSQGITNTITSVQKDNLIVEPIIFQTGRGYNKGGMHEICPPITSNSFERNNHIVEDVRQLNPSKESVGAQPYKQNRLYDAEAVSPVLDTECGRPSYLINSRIRRLTPLECWRLQAFPDENFYKAKEVNSDTQLYKQAGNSMTSSVMKAIIKNLLPILLE